MVQLAVKFEKPPRVKFNEFLKSTLSFVQLAHDVNEHFPDVSELDFTIKRFWLHYFQLKTAANGLNYTEMMEVDYDCDKQQNPKESSFFYCSDDRYFKGVLVRLKAIDDLNTKLKVYFR